MTIISVRGTTNLAMWYEGCSGGGHHMNMDDIFIVGHFGSAFGGDLVVVVAVVVENEGSDLRIKVKLTLEEILTGAKRKLGYTSVLAEGVEHSNCSTCNGTGRVKRVTNTI